MDVKTLCLGVLSMGDRSGYDIKKTLEESFHHFFRAGYGSIYPALAELERGGYVAVREVAQEGRPAKKVYAITRAGRDALTCRLAGEEPRHVVRSEFLVLMYFAHLLPAERLSAVIDAMIVRFKDGLAADLDHYERTHAELTPGQRFALGYGRTVVAAALDYLERHRDGLERAVAVTDETGRPRRGSDLAAAGD
jgi:DNA-binding PadR family transcriptional regulator